MNDAAPRTRARFGRMARRLLGAMAIAALLPTLAAVGGSYLFFRSALLTELERRQREVAFRASDRLSSELDAIFLRLGSKAFDPHPMGEEEPFAVAVQLGRDLPEIDALFWLDERGRERSRWDRWRVVTAEDLRDRGDSSLFATTRSGLEFLGTVDVSELGEPTVEVAVPLRGPRQEAWGAIGAVVNLKTMWERAHELGPSSEGSVYVVDERGKVIGHANPALVLRGLDASDVETVAALHGPTEVQTPRAKGLTGETVQFAGAPVRRTGWLVLAETPLDVALRGHHESLLGSLVVLALVLGGTGLYVRVSAERIAQPLRELTGQARSLAGDPGLPDASEDSGVDEVEVLTQAFGRMRTALADKERGLRWNAERLGSLHEMERGILRGVPSSQLASLAASAFARIGIEVDVAVSERLDGKPVPVSVSSGALAEEAERIALSAADLEETESETSFLQFPMVSESTEVGRAAFVSRSAQLTASHVADVARQLADTLTIAVEKSRLGESLEHERAYVSQIIDAAPTIICTLSPDGIVGSINPALREMTGLDASQVVGRPASSLDFLGFDESFTPPEPGKVMQWEREVESPDGNPRVLSWTASSRPSREGGIEEVIVIGTDMTEQRRLETRLRLAQKMEAVGQLAGGIAHDFNNLLTVIVGYSTLLLGDERLDSKSRARIEQVARAGDRAASLVQQLLAFSRRQVMHPRTIRVNALLTELRPFLSRLLEESIRLVFVLAPDVWSTRFDPVQLEQVVLNLAVNARDAMPQGGSLTFKTANLTLEVPTRRGQVSVPEGQYVKFTVSDTGEGIASEALDRVFEPFFTTKEPGKGTGLGLSTVYGVIKQSGGYIFVSSEKGRGTRFEILLPRVETEEAAATKSPPEEVERGGETVLVVEDDERVRRLVVSVLEGLGYRVLAARNGKDAMAVAGRFEGEIDLLVTDAVMPRLNGPALARELRKRRKGLRVLLTSGYIQRDELDRGLEAAFLEKPFTPDDLGRKIREVLEGGAAP